MLTQAMPSLVRALDGVLPPEALKQLTQALGNCNQPLSSRSDVSLQPPTLRTDRGLIYGDRWDPNNPDYRNLIPDSGPDPFVVDVPGWNGPGAWNNNNYAGNNFNFSTPQYFNASNYYGGPTFNVGGNSFFDTVNTTNINVSLINGEPPAPVAGPAGPPGAAGRDGADGQDAAMFAAIRILQYATNGTRILNLARRQLPIPQGVVTSQGVPVVDLPNYEVDAQALDAATTAPHSIDIPTYEITGSIPLTASLSDTQAVTGFVDVPTGITGTASFSASDIDLEDSGETLPIDGDVDVPTTIGGDVTVTGTVDVPDVAGTVTVTGTVTVDVLEGETVSCNITVPVFSFDPETCELSETTREISVTIPKFGVTASSFSATHDLSLSAATTVSLNISATADATGLILGDVQPLPVTGTVPKLRVASESISVSHQLSLSGTGATAALGLRDGTVPKLEVASHTLAISQTGDTEEVTVDLPVYSLPALTATPDGQAAVDMTPVTYVFNGAQNPDLWLKDIVAAPADRALAAVFVP